MHKIIYTTVALAVLGWSGSAWAVLQETTLTLTDNGKPLPEAKITLNRITDSEPAPEPKTEKTDDSGKIVIVHDDKDKTSNSTIDIIVQTSEGKTLTIHPEEAATVERLRALRASGLTLRAVIDQATAEGLLNRAGKPFTLAAVHKLVRDARDVAA